MPVFPSTSLTGPHQRLHDLIVDLGLAVEDEVQVGRYRVDCYIREVHVAVEYDGPKHRGQRARRHDEARDDWLRTNAWLPVLRVREGDDWSSVPDRVRDFVVWWGESAEERRIRGGAWFA